jgi:hypothetical protein
MRNNFPRGQDSISIIFLPVVDREGLGGSRRCHELITSSPESAAPRVSADGNRCKGERAKVLIFLYAAHFLYDASSTS